MNIETIYLKVQDRLNSLSTGEEQKISKRQFVYAFNKMQLHWLEDQIRFESIDKINQDRIQPFLKEYSSIPVTTGKKYITINLPEDYFHYSRVEGTNCGSCNTCVHAYPRNESSAGRLLQDSFQSPSLEWEETFFTLGDNKVRFYTDKKFNCDKITLYYYRCLKEVDMEGIIHTDGRKGTNINSELTKTSLEQVITYVVELLSGDIMDQGRYQITNNRINKQH